MNVLDEKTKNSIIVKTHKEYMNSQITLKEYMKRLEAIKAVYDLQKTINEYREKILECEITQKDIYESLPISCRIGDK